MDKYHQFSIRLSRLHYTDDYIKDTFDKYCRIYFDRLSSKYNIKDKFEDLAKVDIIHKIELPTEYKEVLAGTEVDLDIKPLRDFNLLICPENTLIAFEELKSNYSNDLDKFIATSAAHEVCHLVADILGKSSKGDRHSKFWREIYRPLKLENTNLDLRYDPENDKADFGIHFPSHISRRTFIGRYPDGLGIIKYK